MAISKGDSFLVSDSLDELAVCSTEGWRKGYYDDFGLFDSVGSYWSVKASVEKEPTMLDRLINRRLTVQLTLDELEQGATTRAVRAICNLIDSGPDDLCCQLMEPSELKQRFLGVSDPSALIDLALTLGADDS